MESYRQGDLLLVRAERPRGEWVVVESGVVELGETTGHAHVLEGGVVLELSDRWSSAKFLCSDGSAELVHDEHKTIRLPEGEYRVVRQREHLGDGQWANVSD